MSLFGPPAWKKIEVFQGEPHRAYTSKGLVHGAGFTAGQCAANMQRAAHKKGADAVIHATFQAAATGARSTGTAVEWRKSAVDLYNAVGATSIHEYVTAGLPKEALGTLKRFEDARERGEKPSWWKTVLGG